MYVRIYIVIHLSFVQILSNTNYVDKHLEQHKLDNILDKSLHYGIYSKVTIFMLYSIMYHKFQWCGLHVL